MNKTNSIILVTFGWLFLTVYAMANDEPRPFEEIYSEIGYKTVEAAADDFEQHFQQKLILPLRVPPISFTHHFGRFNDLDGEMNDYFEVKFISDQIPEHHFKIDIRPIKYKIPLKKEDILNTFTLKNGNTSSYMTVSDFNVLAFESNDWQYMLWIDQRVSDKVSPETLVNIANSINYSTEPKK
ncbi:hypothetical protein AEA09_08495 [Lysinibacillus contaminans]|uniref:Carbon monoxide dehydrogenase n=1 Tax=Lysinibacillus contaminans TaxID=1293441 RepID=A0ABR5K156_9BACI|nr:hypothetical protein [Lysinibacillus contaminans]KOS68584.1 hypothetical protein AEA09_08495 [Lysinibacillus contaminans]